MDIVDLYLTETEAAIRSLSRQDLRTIVAALEQAWLRSSTIYIIGNGGSASTASHMMNDLCKFTRVHRVPPLRAIALTDNVPLMTAIANDYAYEDIFSGALDCLMRPGDVVIAISGSGNSPNILKACEYARDNGGIVIGLIGRPGGKLKELCTHHIIVPADRIGQQEDGHLIINHTIALALRERIEVQALQNRTVPTLQGEVYPAPKQLDTAP